MHQSVEDVVACCVFGIRIRIDQVVGDQEGDRVGALSIDLLLCVDTSIDKGLNHACNVRDQILVIQEDVVLQGPEGDHFVGLPL